MGVKTNSEDSSDISPPLPPASITSVEKKGLFSFLKKNKVPSDLKELERDMKARENKVGKLESLYREAVDHDKDYKKRVKDLEEREALLKTIDKRNLSQQLKLDELKKALEDKEKQVTEREATVQKLQKEMKSSQDGSLQHQVIKKEEKISQLSQEVKRLQDIVENRETNLEVKEHIAKAKHQELEEKHKSVQKKEQVLSELEGKHQREIEFIEKLKRRVDHENRERENILKRFESELKAKELELAKKESTLGGLEKQYKSAVDKGSELTELKKLLAEKEKQIVAVSKDPGIAKIQKQLQEKERLFMEKSLLADKLKAEIELKNSQIEELSHSANDKDLVKLQKKYENQLQKAIADAEKQKNQLITNNNTLQELQNQLKIAQNDNQSLRKAIEEAKDTSQVARLQKNYTSILEDVQKKDLLVKELQMQNKGLSEQVRQLGKSHDYKSSETGKLQEKLLELKELAGKRNYQILELKRNAVLDKQKMTERESELATKEKILTDLDRRHLKKSLELSKKHLELEEKEKLLEEKELHIKDALKTSTYYQKEIDARDKELAVVKKNIVEMSQQLMGKEEAHDNIKIAHQNLIHEVEEKRKNLNTTLEELENLKKEFTFVEDKLKEKHIEIDSLKTEFENTHKDIRKKSKEIEKKESFLKESEKQHLTKSLELSRKSLELTEQERQVKKKTDELAEKERELTAVSREIKKAGAEIEKRESELQAVKEEITKARQEVDDLHLLHNKRHGTLEEKERHLSTKERTLTELDKKHQLLAVDFEKKSSVHSEKERLLNDRTHALELKDKEVSSLEKDLKNKEDKLRKLEATLSGKEEEVKRIKELIPILKNKEEELKALDEKIASRQIELSQKSLELDSQEKEVAIKSSEKNLLGKKMNLLQKKEEMVGVLDKGLRRNRAQFKYLTTLLKKKQDLLQTRNRDLLDREIFRMKQEGRIKELQSDISIKRVDMQEEFSKREKELGHLKTEWDMQESILKNNIDQIRDKEEVLKSAAKDTKKQIETIRKRQKEMLETQKLMQKDMQLIVTQKGELDKKINELLKIDALIQQKEKAIDAKKEIIEKSLMKKEEQLNVALEKVRDTKEYKEKIPSMKKQRDALKKQMETYATRLKEAEDKFDSMSKEALAKREYLKDMENKLAIQEKKLLAFASELKEKDTMLRKKEMLLKTEAQKVDQDKFKRYMERELQTGKVEDEHAPLIEESSFAEITLEKPKIQNSYESMSSLIRHARRLVATGEFDSARSLCSQIETAYQKISDNEDKRKIGYDILELKTDIKLASL